MYTKTKRRKPINRTSKNKSLKRSYKSAKRPLNKSVRIGSRNLESRIRGRYIFIGIVLVLLFIIIIVRLFKLQILSKDKYYEQLRAKFP